jgi:hypothetical protein
VSISGTKPTGTPPAAFAFFLFAGFWALGAVLLSAKLWTEPPAMSGDEASRLAVNGHALTAAAVCLVGATVCVAAGVTIGEIVKRQPAEVSRR